MTARRDAGQTGFVPGKVLRRLLQEQPTPFYLSKHSLDTQGIGLGLPLAKSIIEGQNGVISVQSEVGKGTLFTLSFLTDL